MMHSMGHESPIGEHNFSAEQALDHTAQILYHTVDQLVERNTPPDSYSIDTQRIPFGRYGDGYLAASLSSDQGFHAATLSYVAPPDEARANEKSASFLLRRNIEHDRWWMANKHTSDEGVLRYLDANWPQHLIDNNPVRQAIDADDPGFSTVFALVHDYLIPHARYRLTEKIYSFSRINIDELSGDCSATSLVAGVKTDQDGFQSYAADIAQPYVVNGTPTELHSTLTIDDMGTPSLSSWYDYPVTDKQGNTRSKRAIVPIHDTRALCREYELMLNELLKEKLPAREN